MEMTPAYYTEKRLLNGGALVFCSAVVVQLVQLPPPQLTTDLKLALWAAAIAIPVLAGILWMHVQQEPTKIRHEENYVWSLIAVGQLATFMCATAIFTHFSRAGGLLFFLLGAVMLWCVLRDDRYQKKVNAPLADSRSLYVSWAEWWDDTWTVLRVTLLLLCGWQLVRVAAQQYL